MENSRLVAAQQAIPPCGTDLPITYLKFRNLILCIRPNELNHKKASEKLEVFEEALRKLSDCSPVEDDSSAEFLGDAYDIVRAAKMCHEIFFPSAVHASQLPLQVDALRVLHKAALVSLANLHGKSSKQLLQGQWKDSDSDENLEASAQNWISASELTFIKGKVDAYFSLEEERLSAQLDVVLNRVYCHQPSELRQRKNEKELETLAAELDKTIDGIFKAKEYSTLLSLLP